MSLPVLAGLGALSAAILLGGVAVVASGVTQPGTPASLAGTAPTAAGSSSDGPGGLVLPPTASATAPAAAATSPGTAPAGTATPGSSASAAATVPAGTDTPGATASGATTSGATTSGAPARAGATSPAAGPSARPKAGASRSSSAAPATSGSGAPVGPGSTPPPASSAGAAPGSYTENVTGTVTSPLGTMDASGSATLKVDQAVGQTQTQTVTDSESTTVEKLVFGNSRVDATELSISSEAGSYDFVLSPQEPIAELTAGASWSWQADSTDGKEHLALSGSYQGTETVTVGTQTLTCAIIKSTLTLTGSLSATSDQTDDYSTAYRLVAREHAVLKGTYKGFPFTSDTTSTLASTTPA